jgi:hypothetical protein
LPKRKRKVLTPMGEGRVVQILPLRQSVIVDIPEIGPRQFTMEDLDRAEKIARGETVEPHPDEKPKHGGHISRSDDHDEAQSSIMEGDQHSSRKRRGRSSRRSKDN